MAETSTADQTPASVLDALDALLPGLAAQAERAAEQRRLPRETVDALRSAGVTRLLQPARHGGFEADPRTFCRAVIELSSVCGATGWVAGIIGVHAYHLGLYDDAVQEEVWADDIDTWISSSYAPSGRAHAVPGGYVVSGRWSFSSGSMDSDWVFVGAMASSDGAEPEYRHFLLPRDDYTIDDVWHVNGLSGTGSNDIIVDERFVPSRRSMSVTDLVAGHHPGREVNTAPLYLMPWAAVFLPAVVAPIVGMARGVLGHAVDFHRGRVANADDGSITGLPHPVTLVRLAEASSDIDMAETQLTSRLGEMWAYCLDGAVPPTDLRAKARRDHVTSVKRAVEGADKAYESAGPRSISTANPIQRLWRDVHAGHHHVVNLPDMVMSAFGAYLITDRIQDQTI